MHLTTGRGAVGARLTRGCATLGWVLSTVLLASPAPCQTDAQRAGARAAATAGAQAFTEQRWADAADLFARAEGVVHSPVQLVYLARCHEKLGQLVKAREAYLRVVNETIAANAPEPWRDAKADAQTESAALEPRISYVTIRVDSAPSVPVRVTMDGVELLNAFIGVPQPVDPGTHKLTASAKEEGDAAAQVTVAEGKRETVVLTFRTRAVFSGSPAASPAGEPKSVEPTGPPPRADSAGGVSPLVWTAFGVGAVGLGVGTIFALKTSSKLDEANGLCNVLAPSGAQACPDDKESQINALDDSARSAKTIAVVGFVVGGLGAATGATLLLLAAPAKRSTSVGSAGFQPWVGLGSAGVRGRF